MRSPGPKTAAPTSSTRRKTEADRRQAAVFRQIFRFTAKAKASQCEAFAFGWRERLSCFANAKVGRREARQPFGKRNLDHLGQSPLHRLASLAPTFRRAEFLLTTVDTSATIVNRFHGGPPDKFSYDFDGRNVTSPVRGVSEKTHGGYHISKKKARRSAGLCMLSEFKL